MLIPAHLKPGDKIAIVATAKRLESEIEQSIEIVKAWGLVPVFGQHTLTNHGYFAGTDEQKLEDLNWALNDAEVKAIIFLRGGYGTTRILDRVDYAALKGNPKWLVGFSDLTSLLLHLENIGIAGIHGPMLASIGRDDASDNALKELLFGETSFSYTLSAVTQEVTIEAPITGGNLCLVAESIGSENEIDLEGKILFLEEVGEQMYSIDRMLNKLKRCGKLDGCRGLIIGSFSNIGNANNYFSETVEELVSSYFSHLNIPIAYGLMAGHENQNLPLCIGRNAKVQFLKDRLEIGYLL